MKNYNMFYAADMINEKENGPEYLLGIYNDFKYGLTEVNKRIHKNQGYFKFTQRELEPQDIMELKNNIKLLTPEKNYFTDCGSELLATLNQTNKTDLEQA